MGEGCGTSAYLRGLVRARSTRGLESVHGNPIGPRDKLLWHPDKLLELRTAGKTSAPINVEIDLSNRCSLGCEWCHFAYTHTRGPLKGKRAKPAGAVLGGDLMEPDLIGSILAQ